LYFNPHFKEMKDGRTEFLLSKPPTLDIVDKIDKSQQEACSFPYHVLVKRLLCF
jgi:hypothetical protein